MVTVSSLTEKLAWKESGPWVHHWVVIALASLTLGLHPNTRCLWAPVLLPPSSGPSLLSWPELWHSVPVPSPASWMAFRPCCRLSTGLFSGRPLDTCCSLVSNSVSGPISYCSCLDSLGGSWTWIHCLDLSGTADGPCHQHLALPMLSRC